jgi:hypothetical protein
MRSITTRLSVRPGASKPWKKPAVANRQVASERVNSATRRFFGQIPLGEDRDLDALAHRCGGRRPSPSSW